ncbi:MAG: PHP domain-containing protein [Deltaproteobacteria bacterium]|nr:PHP domain-containing protein [Deltaproteobacteria bacterium]
MARFADTHIHTTASPCGFIEPSRLLQRAADCGLDCIVITDHNTTKGAKEVLERQASNPRFLDIEVVVGIETLTQYGEIALIYMDGEDAKAIEALRPGPAEPFLLESLLSEVEKRKNAGKRILSGVVHPFSSGLRGAFRFGDYLRDNARYYAASENSGRYVDVDWWLEVVGIPSNERSEFDNTAVVALFELFRRFDFVEVFNGANFFPSENRKAAALARVFDKPGTCGSDAHLSAAVGSARTMYFGSSLRDAILNREVQTVAKRFNYPKAFVFRSASGFKRHVWRKLPFKNT